MATKTTKKKRSNLQRWLFTLKRKQTSPKLENQAQKGIIDLQELIHSQEIDQLLNKKTTDYCK